VVCVNYQGLKQQGAAMVNGGVPRCNMRAAEGSSNE